MISFLKKKLKKHYERKSPRIYISKLHDISLKIKNSNQDNKYLEYSVHNISTMGISFDCENAVKKFKKDEILNIVIQIFLTSVNCDIKVVHVSETLVGCQFTNISERFVNEILSYFQSEIEALSVSYINADKLRSDPDGTPFWCYGGENFELFYVERDQVILKYRIRVFGNHIERDQMGKFIIGQIWEEGIADKMSYDKSDLIRPTDKMQQDIIQLATRFITSLQKVPTAYREQIVKDLANIDVFQ